MLEALALHADALPLRTAASLVGRLNHALNWANHDPRTNGEARVLRVLGGAAGQVLDVGAHHGAWALEALRLCPRAGVHCFEISTPTRRVLAEAMRVHRRVRVAPFGLLDRPADARLKYYPGRDEVSSLFDYPHPEGHVWCRERVETGDSYLDEQGIERVELLKLDVEGAEPLVLRGFERALALGRIRAVQFEYGRVNILTRFLLRDFYELFEARGFRVGKVRRHRVVFRPYRFEHETFFGCNYLAVRREEAGLIDRLAGPSLDRGDRPTPRAAPG